MAKSKQNAKHHIDQFKSRFGAGQRLNRFMVHVNKFPTAFGDISVSSPGWEGWLCQDVTLPGKELGYEEWSAHGIKRHMPTGTVSYGGTTDLTFICDQSFLDRMIFEGWLRWIHSAEYDDGLSNSDVTPKSKELQIGNFKEDHIFHYYNEITGEFRVTTYSQGGEPNMIYTFHEAYPVAFSETPLSMATTDTLMNFTVTMCYRYFTTEYATEFASPEYLSGQRHEPMEGKGPDINRGRSIFDAIGQGLVLGSRFSDKFDNLLRIFNQLDIADRRIGRAARNFGLGSADTDFITRLRNRTGG